MLKLSKYFFFFFPFFCSHLKFRCGSFEIHLRVEVMEGTDAIFSSMLLAGLLVRQFTTCLPFENIAFIKHKISKYIRLIPVIFLCIFPIHILFLISTVYSSTYFPWYSSMLSGSFRVVLLCS